MTFNPDTDAAGAAQLVRRLLLDLARHEEETAAREAAAVPYWQPHPSSVAGHRAAAVVLRGEADRFPYAS